VRTNGGEREREKKSEFFFLPVFHPPHLSKTSLTPKKNSGVRTAPQRAREVVHRAQQNAAAARLARGLAAEREAKVDVQVRLFFFLLLLSLFAFRPRSRAHLEGGKKE
jgi:hypothetical protein